MRFTRFSGFAATAVLGAATVFGGAGIAQAQSLDSLIPGSSAPQGIGLTLDVATTKAASGTITNNTDVTLESCTGLVSSAEAVRDIEAAYKKGIEVGSELPQELVDVLMAADAKGHNWRAGSANPIPIGKTADWTGSKVGPRATEDYQAGVLIQCQVGGYEDPTFVYAFDYESGPAGSLDLGSLGDVQGSIGNLLGSSN